MPSRRGSVYIVILGVAMLVTVMGMGALLTTRLAGRQATNATDWEDAGTLATSAVETAMSSLNAKITANPAGWRSGFVSFTTGNTPAFSGTLGRGTMSWVVKDQYDGNFSDDYADPIQLYGIGNIGQATRVYSVQVVPAGAGMDVLRCALHAGGSITLTGSSTLGAGPISSNSNTSMSGQVYGNIESYTESGGTGGISGTLKTGSSVVKAMPAAALFNLYAAKATTISGFDNGGTFSPGLLSPTYNPYGATNPDGVYYINMSGGSKTLTISSSRIIGTLVILMGNKDTLTINGPVQWNANRADYPILLVASSNNTATVNITGSTTWLSEATVGMDLNGNGTQTDDLQPKYTGVIHIIGSGSALRLYSNAYVQGSVITEGTVATGNQITLVSDPTLLTNPPIGYGAGSQLMIVPGSYVWDSPP